MLHDVELLGRSMVEAIEPKLQDYGLEWKNVVFMGFGKGAGIILYAAPLAPPTAAKRDRGEASKRRARNASRKILRGVSAAAVAGVYPQNLLRGLGFFLQSTQELACIRSGKPILSPRKSKRDHGKVDQDCTSP